MMIMIIMTVTVALLTGAAYADNENGTATADDFGNLPAEEKKYTEPMNILGKTVRVFSDKICLEEYCKAGETLPVYIAGAVGLKTQDSIRLQIAHCGYQELAPVACAGGDTPRAVHADNEGSGSFYAEWTVRKSYYKGLYGVVAVTDGKRLRVGNTMADVMNGNLNDRFLILDNTKETQFIEVTAEDATIRVLDMVYGKTSGTVSYEICAKRDLINPTFEIISDSKIDHPSHEITLKEGECHEDEYTILAKSPNTIFVPLASYGDADARDLGAWGADSRNVDAGGVEPQKVGAVENEIPDWVRQVAEWWVQGLIPDEVYIQSLEYLIEVGVIRVGAS